jgi:hypothetical protein
MQLLAESHNRGANGLWIFRNNQRKQKHGELSALA